MWKRTFSILLTPVKFLPTFEGSLLLGGRFFQAFMVILYTHMYQTATTVVEYKMMNHVTLWYSRNYSGLSCTFCNTLHCIYALSRISILPCSPSGAFSLILSPRQY